MSSDNIDSARAAFSQFEQDMTKSGAENYLRAAFDYALEIIEDIDSDAQSKKVAKNLINTYRGKLIENISAKLDDAGSFDDEYYSHWMSLVVMFRDMGCDEDNKLSDLYKALLSKIFKTLSKEEKSLLLQELQHDLDSK